MERVNKYMMLREQTVDCSQFATLNKDLEELTFHYCHIENLSAVTKMPLLRIIRFTSCTFGTGNLQALSGAPALARINVYDMCAEGLTELYGLKKLKRIAIRNVTGIELESLEEFINLYTLEIDNMGLHDGTFIGKLVNLRRLDLHKHVMDNLDFLEQLPSLYKFNLLNAAKNEEGLMAVAGLSNLKEFIYPVKDLSIYRNLPKLEAAGMAPDVHNGFEVFAGSKVCRFVVCGKSSHKNNDRIAEQMKKYVRIYSYGNSG